MALAMAQFAMTGWAAPAAGEALGRARQLCARLNLAVRQKHVLLHCSSMPEEVATKGKFENRKLPNCQIAKFENATITNFRISF
jgi:hypothetical protein